MMKLAGFSDPEARAKQIIELEHSIAQKHRTLAENEDIHKANNTWKQADFPAKAPGLDWAEYFRGAGLNQQTASTCGSRTAFTGESALVQSTPLETWKDWLAFHLIEEYSGVLPKAFDDERFAFLGKMLSGSAAAASALAARRVRRGRPARRCRGQDLCREATFLPRPKPKPRPWSRT